jgi:hypothetical protein
MQLCSMVATAATVASVERASTTRISDQEMSFKSNQQSGSGRKEPARSEESDYEGEHAVLNVLLTFSPGPVSGGQA